MRLSGIIEDSTADQRQDPGADKTRKEEGGLHQARLDVNDRRDDLVRRRNEFDLTQRRRPTITGIGIPYSIDSIVFGGDAFGLEDYSDDDAIVVHKKQRRGRP